MLHYLLKIKQMKNWNSKVSVNNFATEKKGFQREKEMCLWINNVNERVFNLLESRESMRLDDWKASTGGKMSSNLEGVKFDFEIISNEA